MTHGHELDPVTADVYDLFRRQPGDTFDIEAIARQLGYDADAIEPSLAHLLGTGLIVKRGDGSETAYVLSTAAPEL